MTSKLKIEMTGPGQGRVWLDGVELTCVMGFSVSCRVGEINCATIVLGVSELEIEGPFEVDPEPSV